MPCFQVVVGAVAHAPQEQVFRHIVPMDLSGIFTGYGPLPAVTGTSDQTGGRDAAGQTRGVMLSDGGRARERLDRYEPPGHFSYTVSGFTGALGRLASSASGEWWFDAGPATDITAVLWRYVFVARSWLTSPLV